MRKKAVIMTHGGVGDFLFQLDLAKRLESNGIETLFLARKNVGFLAEILNASNVSGAKINSAQGLRYLWAFLYILALSLVKEVFIINSFYFTHLRFPTKMLYKLSNFLGARIIVCRREEVNPMDYEQIVYKAGELIWQRNNRIVSYITGGFIEQGFPSISFSVDKPFSDADYVHIHPVASNLLKSYPPDKLLTALQLLEGNQRILITMTPDAERWYVTDELKNYMNNRHNITFISKRFSFSEISGFIRGARKFITVNTGLLWLALMLGQKVIVCDIETHEEWNPALYGAERLYPATPDKLIQALNI